MREDGGFILLLSPLSHKAYSLQTFEFCFRAFSTLMRSALEWERTARSYLWGIQELPSQKIMAKVSLPRPNMVDPSAQVEATVLDRKPLMQRSNVVNGTRALPNPGHTRCGLSPLKLSTRTPMTLCIVTPIIVIGQPLYSPGTRTTLDAFLRTSSRKPGSLCIIVSPIHRRSTFKRRCCVFCSMTETLTYWVRFVQIIVIYPRRCEAYGIVRSFASLMSTQELPSESNNEHLPGVSRFCKEALNMRSVMEAQGSVLNFLFEDICTLLICNPCRSYAVACCAETDKSF